MLISHSEGHGSSADQLRVLIVTESFLPQVNGVTNSVCRVLENLQLLGCTTEVIAPTGPELYSGATVHRVGGIELPGYQGFTLGLASRRRIRRIMTEFRPDVVHAASPFVLGHAAVRAANSLQIPVVSIFQTDMVGFAFRYRMRATEPIVKHQLRRIHRKSDLTLAPSSASMDQLQHLGIPRLRFWPRGIDTLRFSPTNRDETLRTELVGSAKRPESVNRDLLIGYVGRLAKEKNLHHLAPLQNVPGVRLVIVGDGPERENLGTLLPEALFLGELTGRQLTTLIATLDIFVHPGSEETFCQAVQESLASGVPAIGPASGGLKDRISHGVNGLQYRPGDTTCMVRAVERLVNDPCLRSRMATSARLGVVDNSWSRVTELLRAHYLDAISALDPHSPESSPAAADQHQELTSVGL